MRPPRTVAVLGQLVLLSAVGLALMGAVSAAPADALDRIKTDLMCVCGCPHQLGQCGDECGVAPQLIDKARGYLDGGQTVEQVYASFEAEYGQVIYAAPKPEGFNLMAWVLPFVGLALGGLLVWGVIRKLQQPVSETERGDQPIDDKYRKMLEKELAE